MAIVSIGAGAGAGAGAIVAVSAGTPSSTSSFFAHALATRARPSMAAIPNLRILCFSQSGVSSNWQGKPNSRYLSGRLHWEGNGNGSGSGSGNEWELAEVV